MRLLSEHPKQEDAARLAGYLNQKGWESVAEQARSGTWQVWVIDESHLAEAQEATTRFLADPTAPEFQVKPIKAVKLEEPKKRPPLPGAPGKLAQAWNRDQTPLITGILFLLSLLVTLPSMIMKDNSFFNEHLRITSERIPHWIESRSLPEVANGQVWRLITPIFMHFGLFHILFNMMMTFQLGLMVERKLGHLKMLAFVLIAAVLSNVAQFLVTGPHFGGMSGVVYGFFGFIWAYYTIRPDTDMYLPPSTIAILMIWFVMCAVGAIPNVANWAHGVGLVTGILAAAIICRRIPFIKRRKPWKN